MHKISLKKKPKITEKFYDGITTLSENPAIDTKAQKLKFKKVTTGQVMYSLMTIKNKLNQMSLFLAQCQ